MGWSDICYARIFSFENESIAPYLNIRAGMSGMGSAPYEWQSAGQYSGDDVGLIYGGEFGIYMRTQSLGLSIGLLVDTFDPVTGGSGSDSSGNLLYRVDVEGLSYGALINFDFTLSRAEGYLWKFFVGGGYQYLKLESVYTMSAAGQALVSGQSTFSESYKTAAPFGNIGVSTEFHMSGSTTMNVALGYHYSLASGWNHGQGVTNFAGSANQGDGVVLEDGSEKSMDWSYPYVQVGFQFYVDKVR